MDMAAEAFIITFREGIEAALIVGIMLAYLARTGNWRANKWVYFGIAAGIIASLGEAVLVQSLFNGAETAQQSIIAGGTMVVASLLVVTLMLWMWKSAKAIRKETEDRMARYLNGGSMFGIFLLSFAFVFREGSETVLFLYSLSLKSDATAQIIPALTGLAFAAAWGVLIAKGAVRMDLRKFFAITGVLISIFVIEMLASAVHEFQEARVLGPAGTGLLWDFQIWLTTDSAKLLTMLPIVVIPLLFLFLSETNIIGENVMRTKRALVGLRLGAIAMMVVVALFFAKAVAAETPLYDPAPELVTADNGRIALDVAAYNLTDGKLHKFQITVDGTNVRFLVIADGDGNLKTAFDACKVCGPKGFAQVGTDAIVACKRCGVETEVSDIGTDIACHPIPLISTHVGQTIVIDEAALLTGVPYFHVK